VTVRPIAHSSRNAAAVRTARTTAAGLIGGSAPSREQHLQQLIATGSLHGEDHLAGGDLQQEPGLRAASGLRQAQPGHGGDHAGVRGQGEPDRPAGAFYRGRCGGHLLPLADPGRERVGVQRAAPGLGAGSSPIGIKLKVGLAAASPSALFWAGVACGQTAKDCLELALERVQPRPLLTDGADLPGQVDPHLGLQGLAAATWPYRHQPGDVFQAHPDGLGPLDERQLLQRGLIEYPVPVHCPPGR
jgi:hypothetical protein